MRNDLHRAAQIIAAAFTRDYRVIDLAGREAVLPTHRGGDVALVVPQVEVGLGPVIGDEHLAMLERIHGARIDVDVRVHLEQRHLEATALQEPPDRRSRQALAQGRDDAARDKNEFGFASFLADGIHGSVSSARRRSSGVSTSTVGRSVSLTVILYPHSRARNCSSFSASSNGVAGRWVKVSRKSRRYT